MQTFSFTVKMKVADSWVADGFQVADRIDQITEKIQELIPYAYGHECIVSVKITGSPLLEIITSLQNGELEPKD